MKIVINKCYGGFGISPEALIELIKKKSTAVKVMTKRKYHGKESALWRLTEERLKEVSDGFFGDGFVTSVLYKGDKVYMLNDDGDRYGIRTHPDLIAVVEKMGNEASSRFANLKIVEIPDNIEWEIDEYDGTEWIAEKHRTWN